MTITLRQESQTGATTSGSTLTFQQLDNNFIDLLTNKIQAIQVEGDTGANTIGVAQGTGVLEIKGGTNITTAIAADSAGTATLTITGTTFLADIVSDTSPQLGGNLDTNGQQIVTTSAGNLKLYPDGAGVVEIGGGGGSNDGTIQLNCSANSHGIKLASPPHSAGQSYTLTFPSTSPNANDFISTDASGNLKFTKLTAGTGITITNPDSAGDFVITNTVSAGISDVVSDTSPELGGNLSVNGNSIVSTSNGDINITPDNNGKVVIDGINYPQADGQAGDFLVTDGSNNLGFARIRGGADITVTQPDSTGEYSIAFSGSTGIASLANDSSPELAGNLDVGTNSIVSSSNRDIQFSPNGTGQTKATRLQYDEDIHDIGTDSGTKTPDINDGNVQKITLNGNLTLNAFASATAGQSLTLIITQDGSGNRTLSSTMKFAGGVKTLSTGASKVDIMTVFYDGSNYWASLSTDFS